MNYTPQRYLIPDEPCTPFIDSNEIWSIIHSTPSTKERVKEIISKSLSKQRLNLSEVACLANTYDQELVDDIKEGAKILKQNIYGNRIVLFAPLYVGNKCSNNCTYCGFKASNSEAVRKTLSDEEIVQEIESLEEMGHKRLILVYGENAQYSPEYIAHTVKLAYSIKKRNGEIRRVNINAAPLDIEGFETIKKAGIGTFQLFQETYHPDIYKTYHLRGKKADYNYRLTALDRALEAGLDDIGIGVLFGLYDWKFDLLGLVRHVNHLEACFNVGPHTISFPRIKDASMLELGNKYFVSDEDFAKLVAILRLAVPYTGMILTARESAELRDEFINYGVSQIDGGTKIELGAYSEKNSSEADINRGQFRINDNRTLNEIINELIDQDMIPSFCTACYRLGRTGEHFMEFSTPGFIKRFCTPNAILTFSEYLVDYAPKGTTHKGWELISTKIDQLENEEARLSIRDKIEKIKSGNRDLYY